MREDGGVLRASVFVRRGMELFYMEPFTLARTLCVHPLRPPFTRVAYFRRRNPLAPIV